MPHYVNMTELLAPVGSVEALKVAIACKADAVYLGLDCFNARIKADNFTLDNIKEHIDFCHIFGVKVYITFNTCIKQKEIAQFEDYVTRCADFGADAFIVTDLGMLDIFRHFNVPLHASTQLGVHNLEGAALLERLGFSRVVVARETLEQDIIKIKQNTSLEVEYFVHGALCVAFSGNCLLSSMMSGDSGNRGLCNQPCRLEYSTNLNMNSSKFLLSASDQCMISKLDRLISLGIDSFKIEGRLKQPHYVGEAVSQYRYAIDNHKMRDNAVHMLKCAYNRGGFTLGYNAEKTSQIMSCNVASNMGDKLGTVLSWKNNFLTILTLDERKLTSGSGVKIICNNKEVGGFALTDFTQKGRQLSLRQKSFPLNSEVYLTLDKEQVDDFADLEPFIDINMSFVAKVGEQMSLSVSIAEDILFNKNIKNTQKNTITVFGNEVQQAKNSAITTEQIEKQLSKLNDTDFSAVDIDINCDKDCFIAVSELNSLRRDAITKLQKMLIEDYENVQMIERAKTKKHTEILFKNKTNDNANIDYSKPFVVTNDLLNISDKVAANSNIVLEIREFDEQNVQSILKNDLIENNVIKNLYFSFPRICRGKDIAILLHTIELIKTHLNGCICDNLYAVEISKKLGLVTIGGVGLNIYNSKYSDIVGLDAFIPSAELNLQELREIKTCRIIFGFGRLVVMNLTHCPIQLNTNATCQSCKYKGDFVYRDKKEEYLLSRKKLSFCYFDMFNPQTVDIRGKMDKFSSYNFFINSYGYNKSQVESIVYDYINKCGESLPHSTNGHYFRGVK